MSLLHEPLFGSYPIPHETRRVAECAFPKGHPYLRLRDQFGMLVENQHFAHLFAHDGRPALAPARLALVLILQFMENLSDRQAAERVWDAISWKYLLGLQLEDPGFDHSVLSEFRKRLLTDDTADLLFDTVLHLCQEAGLLTARGKQRTDSTRVLGAIRELQRLENVGETLHHALNVLAVAAPGWLLARGDRAWGERYGKRFEHYHLPKDHAARRALVVTIGEDGYRLLRMLFDQSAPTELRELPAIATLRQVWLQQYYWCNDPAAPLVRWREVDEQPPTAQLIRSPYDPEARYKTKRETHWVGYSVHVTETCDDDRPNLITQVTTTLAGPDDHVALAPIQADLASKDLLPAEHYVDSGYVDAQALVESQREHSIKLVGPVQADASWQAHTPDGLTIAQFAVNWEADHVTCPGGKVSVSWQAVKDVHGNAGIGVAFAREDCLACPLREICTKAKAGARRLTLRLRDQHIALQEARLWQESEEFRAQYARRAGVEGTFTQANRRCDLRHARYIGYAKTRLQHLLTAIAINLLRVLAWWAEVPRAVTRTSPIAALMANSA